MVRSVSAREMMFGKMYDENYTLFCGIISNCVAQVYTHTGGSIRNGEGSISTSVHHYTTFDIGGTSFRCNGKSPFSSGDKVVLYATPSNEGYYDVEAFKNFTRQTFCGFLYSMSEDFFLPIVLATLVQSFLSFCIIILPILLVAFGLPILLIKFGLLSVQDGEVLGAVGIVVAFIAAVIIFCGKLSKSIYTARKHKYFLAQLTRELMDYPADFHAAQSDKFINQKELVLVALKNRVPKKYHLKFAQSLGKANAQTLTRLDNLGFKSPLAGFIFSVLLPGVDRIYKGNIIFGILKFLLIATMLVLTPIVGELFIDFAKGSLEGVKPRHIILCVLWIVCFAWYFLDFVLVYRGIKKNNFAKICATLGEKW